MQICLSQMHHRLAETRENLFLNEKTRFEEIEDQFNRENKDRLKLYKELKVKQTQDWQVFLDWQDAHAGNQRTLRLR